MAATLRFFLSGHPEAYEKTFEEGRAEDHFLAFALRRGRFSISWFAVDGGTWIRTDAVVAVSLSEARDMSPNEGQIHHSHVELRDIVLDESLG